MVDCYYRESCGEYRENLRRGYCYPCFPRQRPCCCRGSQGPQGEKGEQGEQGPAGTFLSCYMEALGSGQTVAADTSVVFDINSTDPVGNSIELNAEGTVFTINRTGLYHIEWDVNLAPGTAAAVIGIIENGEGASGASSSTAGNHSSGTLIHVDRVPFTITLYNYDHEITLENPVQWEDSAASIRILRFADGPAL